MNIKEGISWIDNEEQLYILNTLTNKCIILDSVGKELWTKMRETNSLQTIIKDLQGHYDKSEEEKIKQDVIEFYDLLLAMGVIYEEGK